MRDSSNATEQIIVRAKLGEEAALVNLIAQAGPRLRRAIDAELTAVQHDLDATQVWDEVQDEAKRRVNEFPGTTEAEFEAWAERLALRHIRYSLGGRAGNVETMVNTSKTATALSQPTPPTKPDQSPSVAPGKGETGKFDPNATIVPGDLESVQFDPHATVAPGKREAAKYDPNATIAPGANDTIAPSEFATPKHDPHATITDLAAIPLAPQTTKRFGDYEILETIAKGGMGVVYKARQRKLNRIVALKMILAGQFADQEDIDRFYVEAEAAAQLRHTNIVGIFEVGECEGQHYFSMEYIEGKSLGDLVREHPLAPRAAAKFVKTISEAMYYAHQEGVLHRDLKPSNVLVDENDVPLVTDFGLAKRTAEQSQRTAAGSVLGTPSYMPPEQASGKLDQISERSDVYSIGAILYELITGKPPFGAANPWETIKQVISNDPVSPRLLNNTVPADLETICLKCLQKDQARRYQSAKDLADELQRFLTGEPILARPIGVIERSVRWCYRNPWPTVALAVMLFAVVGTSVGFYNASVAKRKSEESLVLLLASINELFTAWGDVTLLNEPGLEDVRTRLLATAKDLYTQIGKKLGADPKVQQGLGDSYFRLGRLMFDLESLADARESVNSGLEIQERLHQEDPDDETWLRAVGDSRNLYGNVLEIAAVVDIRDLTASEKGLDDAGGYYAKAVIAHQELVAKSQGNPGYERQLLNSLSNQAMLEDRRGRLFANHNRSDAAQESYAAARSGVEGVQVRRRQLLGRLIEKSPLHFDVVRDLAEGYFNLAKVTSRLEDFEATISYLDRAIGEFNILHAEYPESLEYQYSQANCWFLVGEAKFDQLSPLANDDPAKMTLAGDAIVAYTNEEELLKELASKSPRAPKYRRDLAQAYLRIGEIHFLFEKPEEDAKALAAYQSAAPILARLLDDFPDDEDRRDLAKVYSRIGEIHSSGKQFEFALEAYKSAAEILEPLVSKFPDDETLLDLRNQAKLRIDGAEQAIREAVDASPPTAPDAAE